MNIFVLVKQVPDTESKIRVAGGGAGIEKGDLKWIINPYDEFAIEEALKTKDKLKAGTVTVLSLGLDRAQEALRTALAMGADNAVLVKADTEIADTCVVAQALAEALKKEGADIVFAGKQGIDDDQSALFAFVAEFLDWPSVSGVSRIEWANDNKTLKAEREIEGGARLTVETTLPAVLALDKGINTPRYASLPGIMKAKKKEIKTYGLADLGLGSAAPTVTESGYALPPERPPGKKLSGDAATQVKELVRLLREEAKVI